MSSIAVLTSPETGAASMADINSNFANLNTDKVESSTLNARTVNGKALSGNITLGLASADYVNQGTITTVLHGNAAGNPSFAAVVEADITLADVTTNDVSTSKHGFVKKLPNDSSVFLDGTGNFSTPLAAPTGSMVMYGGSSSPTGYLLCDGSAVSRTTYSALFALLSTTYGSGDGSTTFNVPDMRGRVPVGVGTGTGGGSSGTGAPTGGSALTAVSRATWKGEETHTQSIGELAAHTHGVTAFDASSAAHTAIQGNSGGGSSGVVAGAATSTGSSTAFNVIQPVMGLNFIIKT